MRTGEKYFLTKIFHGNFVEDIQQSWPFRKMSFIDLKCHFLAQQGIADNKHWDKRFSDKCFSWNFCWSWSTSVTKRKMSSNPWSVHFRVEQGISEKI